jgi:hypothetical protein
VERNETQQCCICERLDNDAGALGTLVEWIHQLAKACLYNAAVSPVSIIETVHGVLPDERGYEVVLAVTSETQNDEVKSGEWFSGPMRFLHRVRADAERIRIGQAVQTHAPEPNLDCPETPVAGQAARKQEEDRKLLLSEARFRKFVPGLAVRRHSIAPLAAKEHAGNLGWLLTFEVALFPAAQSVAPPEKVHVNVHLHEPIPVPEPESGKSVTVLVQDDFGNPRS